MNVEVPAQELPIELDDEPILGWRCWFVQPHEGLLRPIYKRGLRWLPRQAHEAICPEHPHEAPADLCGCGIYSVCHPMLLEEVHWDKAPPADTEPLPGLIVVGQIALWGKVIQGTRGWRAQFAYPKCLYVFDDTRQVADRLREQYLVPVTWGAESAQLRRCLPPPPPPRTRIHDPRVAKAIKDMMGQYWDWDKLSTDFIIERTGINILRSHWARQPAARRVPKLLVDRLDGWMQNFSATINARVENEIHRLGELLSEWPALPPGAGA